jgi:uncharacterized membrane protein
MLSTALLGIPFHPPEDASSNVYILLRYIHILAGITWVGLLYFFNLVNVPFMKEAEAPMKPTIMKSMTLRALFWFRWGAVVTVLAGLIYWMIWAASEAHNGGGSVGMLHGTFFGIWILVFVIEYAVIMVAKVSKGPALAVIMAVLVSLASWGFLCLNSQPYFSNHVLSIGVGGGIGLLMMLNVWGIIWRNNKKVIDGVLAGTPHPDAAVLARQAFLASRTNAWLSLPMLFFMVAASHYSLFGA